MSQDYSDASSDSATKRAIAFVDGFNVYHFLVNHHPWAKWLDYNKLSRVMLPKNVAINDIYYFSAYATWNQGKVARHSHYVSALKAVGVTPIINHFRNREKNVIVRDDASGVYYQTVDGRIPGRVVRGYVNEEKQTDVSIGAHIMALAAKDMFDTALLVSSDTDFLPVVELMRRYFPSKSLVLALPAISVPHSFLQLLPGSSCRRIKGKHLKKSQLDDPVVSPGSGGKRYHRPPEWAV